MDRKFISCTVGALIVALAGAAPPAKAEISTTAEVVFQTHCSGAEASPHPKRLEAAQVILSDGVARFETWALFAGYIGFPDVAGQPSFEAAAGMKRITVDVLLAKSDGSEHKLGRFRGRIASDGTSSVGKILDRTFERGDVLHWRLTFQGTRKLPPGVCFITALGYAQPDSSNEVPALAALGF